MSLAYYTAKIRETGLHEGARVAVGNGLTGTVVRLGSWIEGVCVLVDGARGPAWFPYYGAILDERRKLPGWSCLTCTRTGNGAPPAQCPSCGSDHDDNHGPHPRG